MTANEFYKSKKWGNTEWDREEPHNFCKSEMFDFAEAYFKEKFNKLKQ